jgi:arylesterase / paraoxonase
MKPLKGLLLVVLLLVLLIAGLILKTGWNAGEFKDIVPRNTGMCRLISGVQSSEDITINPRTGMAFISSDARRQWFAGGSAGAQGAIFGFDVSSTRPTLIRLTKDLGFEFHPHGIGLYLPDEGIASLFVVNHKSEGQFVEIFDIRNQTLWHRASISGKVMHSPNDVIPVGPNAFYVTNDHGSTSPLGRKLEDYLQLARSYVLYYDGKGFRKVAENIAYANGINISHDGKTVYVASTIAGGIRLYERDITSGSLTFQKAMDLGTGVDNIEVDSQGNLWIGAHPKLLTFVKYAKDPNILSPSQVLEVRFHGDEKYTVEEIYQNRGSPLSGASVAAVFGRRLMVGSVFDRGFLLCDLPPGIK